MPFPKSQLGAQEIGFMSYSHLPTSGKTCDLFNPRSGGPYQSTLPRHQVQLRQFWYVDVFSVARDLC